MADASDEGVTKALAPRDSSTSYDATARQEAGLRPQALEYDVERVEKVYRKLDLRIIPGMYLLMSHSVANPLTDDGQPSGPCTFCARPSAPILGWHRQ